jgi:rhodanese-related sulfurtransferase
LAIAVDAAASVQLAHQVGVAVLPWAAWAATPDADHRLLVHNLAAHLLPGGWLLAEHPPGEDHPAGPHARACGLHAADLPAELGSWPAELSGWTVYRRTARVTIADLVAEARAGLRRLSPVDLAQRLAADPDCLVLDTRTPSDRARFGVIPGSIHTPRTTLEWQCDPSSGYSLEEIHGFDQMLVVVCNGGYSSSLAAATLQRLGFANATDLAGGVHAWVAAGFPVEAPDHTHLS